MLQNTKVNLLDMDRETMEAFFTAMGEKPFRATQMLKWLHQVGERKFENMSNLSKVLRAQLQESCTLDLPEVISDRLAADGTRKFLLRLADGNAIETVFIPETDRGTLCVSSQVGCTLKCSFCSTGKQGFNRNLSASEIIGQLRVAADKLGHSMDSRVISNVVLMGMGEPLLNFDNVLTAINLMMEDVAYGLSKRRITLSTAGLVPGIDRLSQMCDVSLAVSLHATTDELRNKLVPVNNKYPIAELLAACKRYLDASKPANRKITFEYVLLKGINDSDRDAKRLINLMSQVPSKINLIPFNAFPGSDYEVSSDETIMRFREKLCSAGFVTTVRKTRGDDIDAACGQLAGKVMDRTRRSKNIKVAS